VPAKALCELGTGGVTGTIIALICAYLMYPALLNWTNPKRTHKVFGKGESLLGHRRFAILALITVLGSTALGLGLTRLDTDPSLLDYFRTGKQQRERPGYVDRNGGSNPLIYAGRRSLVIRHWSGEPC
jgi:uncharacterized protein